jgi:hypothetical protein
MGWVAFAHLWLILAPGPGNAKALQSPIEAPSHFTGTAVSDTSIQWSWDAVVGSSTALGATHYELQDEHSNFIASIPGPGTTPVTFTETGLTPDTPYTRHVVAVNGLNVSLPSNNATLTTLQTAPRTETLAEFESTFFGGKIKVEQGTGGNKDKLTVTFPADPGNPRTYTVHTDTSLTVAGEKVTIFTTNADCMPKAGGAMHYGIIFIACFEVAKDCPVDKLSVVQTIRAGSSVKCNGADELFEPFPKLDEGTGATAGNPKSGPTAKSADGTKFYFFDAPGRDAPPSGTVCVHTLRFRLFKACDSEILGFLDWFATFTVGTDAGGKTTVTYSPGPGKPKAEGEAPPRGDFSATNSRSFNTGAADAKPLKDAVDELNKLVAPDKRFTVKAKK